MKNITKSLIIISAVAALAIGGTVAYFSDVEESKNNVISAGTIDISVDSTNPWTRTASYTFANLEPSDSKDIKVVLKNEGTNPAVIWKKVKVTAEVDGTQSEPECYAEGGTWNQAAASGSQCTSQTHKDNLSTQFVYSMKIGVNDNIKKAWDVKVSDINDLWIPIGRLNAGSTLAVDQNYYFDEDAGNAYQGDSMTFDITFYAEQLNAPGPKYVAGSNGVIVDNKNTSSEWEPLVGDGIWGILTWDGSGAFTMKGWGLAGTSYRAVYYNGSTETNIGSGDTPVAGGAVTITGTYAGFGIDDAKYWLRDAGWNSAKTLFEANLVD